MIGEKYLESLNEELILPLMDKLYYYEERMIYTDFHIGIHGLIGSYDFEIDKNMSYPMEKKVIGLHFKVGNLYSTVDKIYRIMNNYIVERFLKKDLNFIFITLAKDIKENGKDIDRLFYTKIQINDEQPQYYFLNYTYDQNFDNFIFNLMDNTSNTLKCYWDFKTNIIKIKVPDIILAKYIIKNVYGGTNGHQ